MSEEKNCLLKMYLCMMSDDTLTDYLEIHSHRKALVCCLQSVFSDIKIWFVDSIPLFEGFFAPQPHPILFVFFSHSLYFTVRPPLYFFLSLFLSRELLFDLFPINWCNGIWTQCVLHMIDSGIIRFLPCHMKFAYKRENVWCSRNECTCIEYNNQIRSTE